MCKTIYFVDDDVAITPLIVKYSIKNRFPGCEIKGTSSLKVALEHAILSTGYTLYILDSNMVLDIDQEHKDKLIELLLTFIDKPKELLADTNLSGFILSPLIKHYDRNCNIILLTAYYQRIKRSMYDNVGISDILERIIDKLISKGGIDPITIEENIDFFLKKEQTVI